MENNNLSYEDALKELKNIIDDLEKDEISLSASVATFKRGIELYKYCNKLISDAEGEVKLLLNNSEGSVVEIDFLEEDD